MLLKYFYPILSFIIFARNFWSFLKDSTEIIQVYSFIIDILFFGAYYGCTLRRVCFSHRASILWFLYSSTLLLRKSYDCYGYFYFEFLLHLVFLSRICLNEDEISLFDTEDHNKKCQEAGSWRKVMQVLSYSWFDKIINLANSDNFKVSEFKKFKFHDSNICVPNEEYLRSNYGKNESTLISIIFKEFWKFYFQIFLFLIATEILLAFIPQIFRNLFIELRDRGNLYICIGYVIIIILLSLLKAFSVSTAVTISTQVSLNVQMFLSNLLYNKVIKISATEINKITKSKIMNLLSSDVDQTSNCLEGMIFTTSLISQIIIQFLILWWFLGNPGFISSFLTVILILFVTVLLAMKSRVYNNKAMEEFDRRIKVLKEFVTWIKVIKINVWEQNFVQKICQIRNKELKNMIVYSILSSISQIIWIFSPAIIIYVSVATYLSYLDEQKFTIEIFIIGSSLLFKINKTFQAIPANVNRIVQMLNSLDRISKFLKSEELEPDEINQIKNLDNDKDDTALEMNHCCLEWPVTNSRSNFSLQEINFRITKGELVGIYGDVGSGKSSLLSAINGEMKLKSGKIKLKGSLSYVFQEPWLFKDTAINNILFYENMDNKRYQQVVESCSLTHDFNQFKDGDSTMVGEKGSNLSGGQKQRINLARGIYKNKDIYVLDNPFSALDNKVTQEVFKKTVGPHGLLKDKTRILLSNNFNNLSKCDRIIILKDGKIVLDKITKELNDKIKKSIIDVALESSNLNGTNTMKLYDKVVKAEAFIEKTKRENYIIRNMTNYERFVEFLSLMTKLSIPLLLLMLFAFFMSRISAIYNTFMIKNLSMNSNMEKSIKTIAFLWIFEVSFLLFGTLILIFGTTYSLKKLHNSIIDNLSQLEYSFFANFVSIGDICSRFGKDLISLDKNLAYDMCFFTTHLIKLICESLFICFIAPISLPFSICFIILYISINISYSKCSVHLNSQKAKSWTSVYLHIAETLDGISTIQNYLKQADFKKKYRKHLEDAQRAHWFDHFGVRWMTFRVQILARLFILITSTIVLFTEEERDPAKIYTILVISFNTAYDFNSISFLYTKMYAHVLKLSRINDLSEIETIKFNEVKSSPPTRIISDNKYHIEFINYSAKYRLKMPFILKNINLKILRGEKIGIVGRTGSGKSSIVLSLMRMIKFSRGDITIDGINKNDYNVHELREKFAYISQEPFIFAGTLRHNLDPINKHTGVKLRNVLSKTFLANSEYNFDLDDEIQEDGANLSCGQKQLIILARTLLSKTEIVIMDEATASVDLNTDRLIQEVIRKHFKDQTVISITHRIDTVLNCNRIIYMDNGEILEQGSPRNLLSDSSSQLYNLTNNLVLN